MSETKIRNNQVVGGIDGWIPIADIYSFSFTLVSTNGVQSFIEWNDTMNMCSYLQKGMKIQWTQNSTVKYAYIIRVEADAGLSYTETTLAGDLVLNTTTYPVTNIKFSMLETPFGFPAYFNWNPSYSAEGSMTFSSVTTNFARYSLIGRTLNFEISADGTTGGTASAGIIFSLPVTPRNASSGKYIIGPVFLDDAGYQSGVMFASSSTMAVRKYNNANYGLGSGRDFHARGSYEV